MLLTVAGYRIVGLDRTGGLLSLRVALQGGPLTGLAQALAKLDGVRVTNGPQGMGRERCFLVHCPGFKVVLSTALDDGQDDVAQALVSRAPQAALAVTSELSGLLERLLIAPPAVEPVPTTPAPPATKTSSLGRGAPLKQGKPLARGAPLKRRTPLARGSWRRPSPP